MSMSFQIDCNWNKRSNLRQKYKELTKKFCKDYYFTYDNKFPHLKSLYKPESMFTYLDDEIQGFNKYLQRIKDYGIKKFKHYKINVNSQPVGKSTLLISVNGQISINNSNKKNNFMETILLQKSNDNKYFIYHTIFKLIK